MSFGSLRGNGSYVFNGVWSIMRKQILDILEGWDQYPPRGGTISPLQVFADGYKLQIDINRREGKPFEL